MTHTASSPNTVEQLKRALVALKEMRSKLDAVERARTEPIAIVGMACRFPGGVETPDQFWHLLQQGMDAIEEIPSDRWNVEDYYSPDPNAAGKSYIRYGGFLQAVDQFDAAFFEISPRETIGTDPQQRLLLEVSWEALENANLPVDRLSNSQTGVFMGMMNNDYARRYQSGSASRIDTYFGTGNSFSFAAGRLSYLLGLQGPSLAVDTACSSSLVTLHLASQSLRSQECDLALAGGVNLILSPDANIFLSKMRAVAPDGRCKTFDASADGYTRGEGCGVLVLKRLSDAQRDGDRIFALVRGSAVNHDGPSGGLTVPSGPAQQRLIRQALTNARVSPEQVSYVEAHGTGTSLGDPIELNALGAVYGTGRSPDQPLWVGSVKTNFGHLEAAAGVAGVIKTVLALQYQEIPPHLHFKQPNPHIPWETLPITVPTTATPWATPSSHLAGISSFGMSGTNAHILLEKAPTGSQPDRPHQSHRPLHLLCLSAKSPAALAQLVQRYLDDCIVYPQRSVADIAYTAAIGRTHFDHRLAIVADSTDPLQTCLTAFLNGEPARSVISPPAAANQPYARPVFLFTGQGSQTIGMGRQLYDTQPIFRAALDRCHDILSEYLPVPLLSVLYPDPAESDDSLIDQTQYAQPALFALEYALAQLWPSWGIQPAVVMGHSVGEYVAACIAGVFSLEDGLKLIAHRARLMQQLPAGGGMSAVFATADRVEAAIAKHNAPDITIAAYNGAESLVLSGPLSSLDTICQKLEAEGIETRSLTVSHAFHSALMEPMLTEFAVVAQSISYQAPKLPIVSNVTGQLAVSNELAQADYWVNHIRASVQFYPGMKTLHQEGYRTFIEVGPHPVLLGMGRRDWPEADEETTLWLASLRRKRADWQQLLESVGRLYVQGATIDWIEFHRDNPAQLLPLPNYPWQRQRYWLELDDPPSRPPSSLKASSIDLSPSNTPSTNWQDWLYQVRWHPQPPLSSANSTTASHWLIFGDTQGLVDRLQYTLQQQGIAHTIVRPSHQFQVVSPNHVHLDPVNPDHMTQILQTLKLQPQQSLRVLHLWSLEQPTASTMDPMAIQHRCCVSLLNLLQATIPSAVKVQLWLVTQGAQRIVERDCQFPHQATLWGLGRVVAMEQPDLWGGLVDLDPHQSLPEMAAELFAQMQIDVGHRQLALRDRQWYNAQLDRADVSPDINKNRVSVQNLDSGAYLITGGLGGLGLTVAQSLVQQGVKSLVLLSRRSPSDTAKEAIADLENQGVHVKVAQADVSDMPMLKSCLTELTTAGITLRGVIHAAGVLDDALLTQQTWSRFAKVMAPKIQGAWNLHQLTRHQPLDCFVLFSSTASLLGAPGQGNYAAANGFLDALAHFRQAQGLPATSINWGPWASVGMAATLDTSTQQRLAAEGIGFIPPDQGISILEHVLQQPPSQIGVLPVDWPTFLQRFAEVTDYWSALQSPVTPTIDNPPVLKLELESLPITEHRSHVVSFLQAALKQILGLPIEAQIEAHQGFSTLGMDSLTAIELRNHLQTSLGRRFASTLTFNYPTIDALATYLLDTLAKADPLQPVVETETASGSNTTSGSNTKPTVPNPGTPNIETPNATAPPSDVLAVEAVQQLSDEDVNALIEAELASLSNLTGGSY